MAAKNLLCRACGKSMPTKDFPKRYQQGVYKKNAPICRSCDLIRATKWRSSSPRNFLAARYREARQRGKRVNISVAENFTLDFLIALLKKQDGRCAVSKLPMTWSVEANKKPTANDRRGTNISIDRIDSSKGYEQSNVRLVCEKVNQIKSSMPDPDLYFWSAQISGSMSGGD